MSAVQAKARRGSSFGSVAERRLSTFQPSDLPEAPLLVVDPSGAAEALAAAVHHKMAGERCAVAVVLPLPRLVVARLAAASLVAQVVEDDHRRALFDQIAAGTVKDSNGTPISEHPLYVEALIHTLIALVRLADELIVGSWAEYERISQLLSYRHPLPRVRPGRDPSVPQTTRVSRDQVIVWGPTRSARELSIFVYALADLHVPWTVVCRDASDAVLPARYVEAPEGPQVLARASVVVDTEPDNPATALALAGLGVPLAVELASGAQEHLAGTCSFDGADRRSILEAVRVALGSAEARVMPSTRGEPPDPGPRIESVRGGPLVSIAIPTRPDRLGLLRHTLPTAFAQSYENLDVIVFDQSGPPGRDETLPEDPRGRIYSQGYVRVTNFLDVAKAAKGEYFSILYDDDLLFPDHVATAVDALERSGAGVAWTDLLVRYLQRTSDTGFHIVGYGLWNNGHQPFDRVSLLAQCTLGNLVPCMMRRELFVELGGIDDSFKLFGDWDLCIRLTQKSEFVYVPRITCQYSRFLDMSNRGTQDWPGAFADTQLIFDRHPSTDRFTVGEGRSRVLQAHSSSTRPVNLPPLAFTSGSMTLEP